MLKRLLLVAVASLVLAPGAFATGGNYVFDGGTSGERAQVQTALDASTFDFSVVPGPVTIHVVRGVVPEATPGQIWLDANLLDTGRFAWGVVQHEYGHQVDFALLDDARRARLQRVLGGAAWCSGAPHGELTCERFADLISWAYWQSPDNVMKPAGGDVTAAAFRALLAQLLPVRTPAAATLTSRPPQNG
jgi:hypothetical protein